MSAIRISTDLEDVDLPLLVSWLGGTYWAANRSRATIERSVKGSLCFTALDGDAMVGFARVVTDQATFAWLCDVVVHPHRRGQGVGKALVEAVLGHPDLVEVRWMLGTRDAHTLYERYGFSTSKEPDRWMTKNFNRRFEGDRS